MVVSSGGFPWITLVVFLPLLGVVGILLAKEEMAKWIGFGVSAVLFLVSLQLWIMFNETTPAMQFVEKHQWIISPSINYAVGIDGISLPLVLLTTFLTPLCILASWTSIETRVREFMISLLVMETATLGVFVALDFVLFYVFWETMLIPMYLLIGVWGGSNRVYAAIKFFLYTLAGSVLLLVAIIVLFFSSGENTFDILTLSQSAYSPTLQAWLFWAFFAAFAVKVPMFPFHTWLPDAHVEAPTAGSVILAAILLKMAGYGFIRFSIGLFPVASDFFTPLIFLLSIIAIVYTSLVALMQEDMKKLIAYSSVAHMGFVTVGIFTFTKQGLEGSIIQMISHGLISAALFLCVGVIYDRVHSRMISSYGGLVHIIPKYAILFMIFTIASTISSM